MANIFGGKRILVLEDDYLIVTGLVAELESSGAEVVGPLPSLEQANALLDKDPAIDVAILDINLRGSKVFPFAERLRNRRIPFVFASAYDDSSIPQPFRDVRRFGKPYSHADIMAALNMETTQQDTSAKH